jgi:cytochrome c553
VLAVLLCCSSSAWAVQKPLLQFAASSTGSSGAKPGCSGCKGSDDALGQPQLAEYQSCSNAYGLAWEPDNNLDR